MGPYEPANTHKANIVKAIAYVDPPVAMSTGPSRIFPLKGLGSGTN